MRVLSEGRGDERPGNFLLVFLIGVAWLAVLGGIVVARTVLGWL